MLVIQDNTSAMFIHWEGNIHCKFKEVILETKPECKHCNPECKHCSVGSVVSFMEIAGLFDSLFEGNMNLCGGDGVCVSACMCMCDD